MYKKSSETNCHTFPDLTQCVAPTNMYSLIKRRDLKYREDLFYKKLKDSTYVYLGYLI